MPLHVSSTCAHHQEVKIVLHSLWYHHTYRCDDTKQNVCASSWLITEINILRCTVKKRKKKIILLFVKSCAAKCLETDGTLDFKVRAELLQQCYSRNDDRNVCGEKCSRHSVLTGERVEMLS